LYFPALLKGEPTAEGVAPEVALDALASLRQLDIETKEKKLEDFEPEWPEWIEDHLNKVARLSGEALSTIDYVFMAEISRWEELLQLLQKMVSLKDQEGQA